MAQKIREIMTTSLVCLDASETVSDAAKAMKEHGIGDVLVMSSDELCGVLTDRDLTVRVLAEDRDPKSTRLDDVCSHEVATLSPDDDVDRAVQLVRERAVRRIPIVEKGRPIGVVSIGDLAVERDETSALADISAAPPNS
jgi:CBS domain-containing protein